MSDEREPLWDDIRISAEAGEATDELDGSVYVRHVISQLLVKMRGDYEAQLSNQYQRIERFVELVNQLERQLDRIPSLEQKINDLQVELSAYQAAYNRTLPPGATR